MNAQNEVKINSYLSFRLGNEVFAIHVNRVHKIMEVCDITEVPKSPAYMKGVINLRGSVLPVIDTRVKFGMAPAERTKSTSILVIDVKIGDEMVKTGMLVDAVHSVLKLEAEDLLPPPSIGNQYKSAIISHMARVKDKFFIVLDIDVVFSSEDQFDLRKISKSKELIREENPGNSQS